jgi:cadmium resistance protein CadD (predicted permease)
MTPAALVGVAVGSFVSTNIDNFLVTTAQFAAAPLQRVRRVAAGQLLGFAFIVLVSAAAAGALFELPTRWVGLLGLVPLALGIRGLVALRHRSQDQHDVNTSVAPGLVAAALVTVGNGGDNLAVYIPILRASKLAEGIFFLLCLLVLDALLCAGALVLGRHPRTLGFVGRAGAYLVPVVYCVIGVIVLVRSGTFDGLF